VHPYYSTWRLPSASDKKGVQLLRGPQSDNTKRASHPISYIYIYIYVFITYLASQSLCELTVLYIYIYIHIWLHFFINIRHSHSSTLCLLLNTWHIRQPSLQALLFLNWFNLLQASLEKSDFGLKYWIVQINQTIGSRTIQPWFLAIYTSTLKHNNFGWPTSNILDPH
jgi:hypothetical protein